MKQEPQICRVPTYVGPRYIRAVEIKPGILLHRDVSGLHSFDSTWALTHKETGCFLVNCITRRQYAQRAAGILANLRDHRCERHWLTMDKRYVRQLRQMRDWLPWANEWPKRIK